MDIYRVWRSQQVNLKHGGGYMTEWFPCNDTIKARSKKEAQSKLERKFAKAGFHSMSLIAVPAGKNPNYG